VAPAGFEPATSAMSARRALRCSTRPFFQSGRQESNLPETAYQTVASPLGIGPEEKYPAGDSNPSGPVESRSATPAASQGIHGSPRRHRGLHQPGRRELNPVLLVQSQACGRYTTPQERSPSGEMVIPVSRILFYAIISLGTYQTIDALLTRSGLFGLHPPRSWRYSAGWPFSASLSSSVLTFLPGGRPPERWLGMITSPERLASASGPQRRGPSVR
jgi:hypothetical protein